MKGQRLGWLLLRKSRVNFITVIIVVSASFMNIYHPPKMSHRVNYESHTFSRLFAGTTLLNGVDSFHMQTMYHLLGCITWSGNPALHGCSCLKHVYPELGFFGVPGWNNFPGHTDKAILLKYLDQIFIQALTWTAGV